jgi:chemotaxis protein methyltransferase CheR
MGIELPPAGRYRYVVFPDADDPGVLGGSGGARRLVDYGPVANPPGSGPRTPGEPRPTLAADEQVFLAWLFARADLDVTRYKPQTQQRRLPACLRALRAATVADARRAIDESPRLARVALTTLLIGVTHFFRDAHVFDHLAERVLPRLAARCRRLRVWSVGCSDGPELYSLAMLLADLGLLDRCDLLGTDCRPDAIERARQGFYDDAAVRGIPAALRDRHMNCEGGHWRVGQRLRDAAQWRTTDILALREPGLWDLVLCRNLAIYLQPPAAAGLWRRLEAAVRPGGVLALGKAERPDCARQFIELGPCLYHRTSNTDVA